jgi:hypothetical protein
MQRVVRPPETAPVILLTEFKAPAIVFLIKDPAPFIIPKPPSNGPLTKPSFGLSNRSVNPVEILVKSPTGLPIIFKLPRTLKT